VLERWRRTLSRAVTRAREDGRGALLWSMRITIAATASYVVGTLFFPGTQPLLAPLTAMLVVQVTPVSLLASGADRVIAVVSGVLLAVGFSAVAPLEWWSLGLLILIAITIGQALRLRSNLIEVAISAMLVLGVGALGAPSAAWQRIAETLVGAAVGIAANLLFPPKVASADAGMAIDDLADTISDLLTGAADELTELATNDGDVAAAARDWLGEARRITHAIPRVGAAVLHAEQGRRFNVRAVGTPDVGPGLRQGLEALEHAAVAIRGMLRAVVDATDDPAWLGDSATDVYLGLAQTLREMAGGVDAFGQLVRDEAEVARRMSAGDVLVVREALDGLHEARARLDDLLMATSAPQGIELFASILSTVKRLLRELDLDERIRRQVQMLRTSRPRASRYGSAGPPGVRPPDSAEPDPDAETQVLPAARRSRRDKRRT
jgi:Aromatic acid exporter family member 1